MLLTPVVMVPVRYLDTTSELICAWVFSPV